MADNNNVVASSSSDISSSGEKILVAVRVRKLLSREAVSADEGSGTHWDYKDSRIWAKADSSKVWSYDRVFTPSADNEEVHAGLVAPVIDSVLQGFNATVFAYGQTASGKTHTMLGNSDDPGVTYRAIDQLFSQIEKKPTEGEEEKRKFLIHVSYIEIYNEKLTDLLLLPDERRKSLSLREDKDGNVRLKNISEVVATSPEEVYDLMSRGEKRRQYGATNINERSSRSHTIFRLIIESFASEEEGEDGAKGKAIKVSQLNLVDLAGSERVAQTGATGKRLDESKDINRSLMNLCLVIEKLSEGNKDHIPYRNSKLTRILKTSLGGNARTVMICTASPAELGQTKSTLDFASRVKNVVQHAKKNESLDDQARIVRMQEEMKALNQKLQQNKLRNQLVVSGVEKEKQDKQSTIQELEQKLQFQETSFKAKLLNMEKQLQSEKEHALQRLQEQHDKDVEEYRATIRRMEEEAQTQAGSHEIRLMQAQKKLDRAKDQSSQLQEKLRKLEEDNMASDSGDTAGNGLRTSLSQRVSSGPDQQVVQASNDDRDKIDSRQTAADSSKNSISDGVGEANDSESRINASIVKGSDGNFQCKFCNKTYKRKRDCGSHIASVHLGLARFPCEECDKVYKTKQTLRNHVKKQHSRPTTMSASSSNWVQIEPETMNQFLHERGVSSDWSCIDVDNRSNLATMSQPVTVVLFLFRKECEVSSSSRVLDGVAEYLKATMAGMRYMELPLRERKKAVRGLIAKRRNVPGDVDRDFAIPCVVLSVNVAEKVVGVMSFCERPELLGELGDDVVVIPFIEQDQILLELNWREKEPICHGEFGEIGEAFLVSCADAIKKHMENDPEEKVRFSLVALAKS